MCITAPQVVEEPASGGGVGRALRCRGGAGAPPDSVGREHAELVALGVRQGRPVRLVPQVRGPAGDQLVGLADDVPVQAVGLGAGARGPARSRASSARRPRRRSASRRRTRVVLGCCAEEVTPPPGQHLGIRAVDADAVDPVVRQPVGSPHERAELVVLRVGHHGPPETGLGAAAPAPCAPRATSSLAPSRSPRRGAAVLDAVRPVDRVHPHRVSWRLAPASRAGGSTSATSSPLTAAQKRACAPTSSASTQRSCHVTRLIRAVNQGCAVLAHGVTGSKRAAGTHPSGGKGRH